jgi:hypothetical protein
MKTALNRLVMGSVLILGLFAGTASAETVFGKISFLGTISEQFDGGYHAQFRMRVAQSTCGSDSTQRDRWIHVRSGRMDGQFAHNSANLKNAYSTLIVALATASNVQIDNVPSCDASVVQTIDLWASQIGIYY